MARRFAASSLEKTFSDARIRHEVERNIQRFNLMERAADSFKFPGLVRELIRRYNRKFDAQDLIPLIGADIEFLTRLDFGIFPAEQRSAFNEAACCNVDPAGTPALEEHFPQILIKNRNLRPLSSLFLFLKKNMGIVTTVEVTTV